MSSFSAKRLFDIILSFLGIVIFLPAWLITVIIIYLEDKGPVYYLQERVGRKGTIFKVIKFRSMIPGAELKTGPIQAKEDDSRVTAVGKFLRKTAMDELPQLINILNGEMSFVGPRALRPSEVESVSGAVTDLVHRPDAILRHSVAPGLTGVAQVFAPTDISTAKKVEYDIWYIKNRTFFMDMWLIVVSFLVTLNATWESRKKKLRFLDDPNIWLNKRQRLCS